MDQKGAGGRTAAEGRPAISGFAPDPSVCRVDGHFYLAVSSFEYFPGIPIWESTDLTTWRLLGNALDRPSQLTFPPLQRWLVADSAPSVVHPADAGSSGLTAPTIRHHGGRFWLTVSSLNELVSGPAVMWADDAAGPWSDPVHVQGLFGIDPDLIWDVDGTCYMALSSYADGVPRVVCAALDAETGVLLGEPFDLWQGTGGIAPEAPHLLRRGDWWYLLLAEGGTERAHSVTIARATSLHGPWEPDPANPILTHRGLPHSVQSTGHADLVELPNGDWALVYLGTRPRGMSPGFHVNGRETFVAGVDWVDGWPHVDETRFLIPESAHDFVDTFNGSQLDPRWVAPASVPAEFSFLSSSGLILSAHDGPRFLGCRTRDEHWAAAAVVRSGTAGIHLRLDRSHFAQLVLHGQRIETTIRIGPIERRTSHGPYASPTVRVGIRARSAGDVPVLMRGPDVIDLAVEIDGQWQVLDSIDGRYLSTEIAGGWTGRMVGPVVDEDEAEVGSFEYRAGSTWI